MRVFIAGARAIKQLDENVSTRINSICQKNYDILIGDADGVDSEVQKNLKEANYRNVTIFASNGIARNNCGNWNIENVKVADNITGYDFYVQKDLKMVEKADVGFMIWNGKSKGTLNNMMNLLKIEKEVVLYYMPSKKFYCFNTIEDLNQFLNSNVKLDSKLKNVLHKNENANFVQASLF